MSLPAFSKHVGVLVDAGLVRRRKVGRSVLCSLEPTALDEVAAWVTDTAAFWRATLDRLERVLDEQSPPQESQSRQHSTEQDA